MTPRTRHARITLTILAAALATLATIGIHHANADPQPPCAAAQTDGYQSASNGCLDDVNRWCTRQHPTEDPGTCADIVFGYIPGPHQDT